jgi:hypothetical protein
MDVPKTISQRIEHESEKVHVHVLLEIHDCNRYNSSKHSKKGTCKCILYIWN